MTHNDNLSFLNYTQKEGNQIGTIEILIHRVDTLHISEGKLPKAEESPLHECRYFTALLCSRKLPYFLYTEVRAAIL